MPDQLPGRIASAMESPEDLAYAESTRAIELQASMLAELRSRCGILIAAASLTTAFLGSAALEHAAFDTLSAIAVMAFVGVLVLSLWIIVPRAGWAFSLSADTLLDDWQGGRCGDISDMKAFVARQIEKNWDSNDALMRAFYLRFALATALLGVDALLWTIKLSGRG
jgi:hypothetical protein